jgi:hypothetical protein
MELSALAAQARDLLQDQQHVVVSKTLRAGYENDIEGDASHSGVRWTSRGHGN